MSSFIFGSQPASDKVAVSVTFSIFLCFFMDTGKIIVKIVLVRIILVLSLIKLFYLAVLNFHKHVNDFFLYRTGREFLLAT